MRRPLIPAVQTDPTQALANHDGEPYGATAEAWLNSAPPLKAVRDMPTIDVIRGDLLLNSDWSELNRIANKRGHKAIQKAFEELSRSNPECFSRLVGALSPDGTPELAFKKLLDLVAEARELKQMSVRSASRSPNSDGRSRRA